MAEPGNLLDLPSDVLEVLFGYLDTVSYGKLMLTCRRMLNCCSDERFWQNRCANDFLVTELSSVNCWRLLYGQQFRHFGRFGIEVYRRIRKSWNKIEKFFAANNSHITFDDGAAWDDIENFKHQLDPSVVLPDDYVCSLMIHNGQKIDESVLNGVSSGAFGSIYAYDDYKTEFLASTMNVLIANGPVNADRHRPSIHLLCLTIAVTNRYWSNSHMLCVSPNEESDSDRKVPWGTVISAPQLRHRYEMPSWKIFNSYTEWLEHYAEALDKNRFALSLNEPVTDDNELLRFYFSPENEVRTGPYTCKVATAFIPENSSLNPARAYFSYRVTFSMDSNADPRLSCQLESRHWVITDDTGKEERVDGPGVIGQFPILKPGSVFSYVSCTYFPTMRGKMTGHFKMKYLSAERSRLDGYINIECPVFVMQAPEGFLLSNNSLSDSIHSSDSQEFLPA